MQLPVSHSQRLDLPDPSPSPDTRLRRDILRSGTYGTLNQQGIAETISLQPSGGSGAVARRPQSHLISTDLRTVVTGSTSADIGVIGLLGDWEVPEIFPKN